MGVPVAPAKAGVARPRKAASQNANRAPKLVSFERRPEGVKSVVMKDPFC